MRQDSQFAGSIPEIYEQCLVPVLFEPYAIDLVERAAMLAPKDVLEIAAGTGVVTRRLARSLAAGRIVATDLNPAMIALAERDAEATNVEYCAADAQNLPFEAATFDLVVAQFGAMFFPDKIAAYREVRRVLRPRGAFLFNVWDRLAANSGSQAVHDAVREAVPDPKPEFIARTPFGYNDPALIVSELKAAGFDKVEIERVERTNPVDQAAQLARGMCLGSPLANELAQHDAAVRDRALAAATAAIASLAEHGPLTMSALVVTATS